MMTEQLYFDDPLILDFTANIVEMVTLSDGRYGAILPETYFYPTSGGQEHDTGILGPARVEDVYKDNGNIIHVLDRSLEQGAYPARIDRATRLANMQHHTAQHILSGAFLKVLGMKSLSANINSHAPSTIDLEAETVPSTDLNKVEEYANGIISENRRVKSYTVNDPAEVPFRRPPKVSGTIRVIEVDGFDYSACGGTHCPQTGMIGMLKIVRTERVNQKLRIHFVAGQQALAFFQQVQAVAQDAAAALNTGLDGVVDGMTRLQSDLKQIQSELDTLRGIVLGVEAEKLAAGAESVGERRLVTAVFENRPAGEIRTLAVRLRENPGMVAVLASFDGKKLVLVAACADDTGLNARDLLNQHLAPFGGRGGGDTGLAQGGGAVNKSVLEILFKQTRNYLHVS